MNKTKTSILQNRNNFEEQKAKRKEINEQREIQLSEMKDRITIMKKQNEEGRQKLINDMNKKYE